MADYKVDATSFREISGFVREKTGIVLEESKSYLIETRLGPLLDEMAVTSYIELCRKARANTEVLNRVIDEISTNETSFYRDRSPYDLLKYRLLPDLMDRKGPSAKINIWSAASSTGQEVYSIAIACREIIGPSAPNHVQIVGTDISNNVLAQASRGSYSSLEIDRGMPPEEKARYFHADGNRWKINDELRAMASFKPLNLLQPFSNIGFFDVVFCRNVAIYFDAPSRTRLFERIAQHLKPQGALIIGSSETMIGVTDIYERKDHMRCAYYVAKV